MFLHNNLHVLCITFCCNFALQLLCHPLHLRIFWRSNIIQLACHPVRLPAPVNTSTREEIALFDSWLELQLRQKLPTFEAQEVEKHQNIIHMNFCHYDCLSFTICWWDTMPYVWLLCDVDIVVILVLLLLLHLECNVGFYFCCMELVIWPVFMSVTGSEFMICELLKFWYWKECLE